MEENNKSSNFQKLINEVLLSINSKEGKEINYFSNLKRDIIFKKFLNKKEIPKYFQSYLLNTKNENEKKEKKFYDKMIDLYSETFRKKELINYNNTKSDITNFINNVKLFTPKKKIIDNFSPENSLKNSSTSPLRNNSSFIIPKENISKIHFKLNNFRESLSIDNKDNLLRNSFKKSNSMKNLNETNPKVSIFQKNLNKILLKNFSKYIPHNSFLKNHNLLYSILHNKYKKNNNNYSQSRASLSNQLIEKTKDDSSIIESQIEFQKKMNSRLNKKKDASNKICFYSVDKNSFFDVTMDNTINKSDFNDKVTSFKKRMDLSGLI